LKQEPSLTKPTWWLLYAIGLLMLGLLALIAALVDEGTGRTILEVAVVVLVVPWMIVWVWRNRAAMELEDWREGRSCWRERPREERGPPSRGDFGFALSVTVKAPLTLLDV